MFSVQLRKHMSADNAYGLKVIWIDKYIWEGKWLKVFFAIFYDDAIVYNHTCTLIMDLVGILCIDVILILPVS